MTVVEPSVGLWDVDTVLMLALFVIAGVSGLVVTWLEIVLEDNGDDFVVEVFTCVLDLVEEAVVGDVLLPGKLDVLSVVGDVKEVDAVVR